MTYSPIVLFVYNRPDHTRRTVSALLQNILAKDSDLIVYSDAAKTELQLEMVDQTRSFIRQISGFKSLTIIERELNLGLSCSIIDGVTSVLNKYGRIIVLEDDLVTSPHFLAYMNEALDRFALDERVASIHGYVYPVKQSLPEAFFLLGADCWGWATWRRAWAHFNPDGQHLLDELKQQQLIGAFDFGGANKFSKMLEEQINGKNDSWAIRWHASAFLATMLTLYPGRSLVHNIGFDSSGSHCGASDSYDTELTSTSINLRDIEIVPSITGHQAFEAFFRQSQASLLQRARRFLVRIMKSI